MEDDRVGPSFHLLLFSLRPISRSLDPRNRHPVLSPLPPYLPLSLPFSFNSHGAYSSLPFICSRKSGFGLASLRLTNGPSLSSLLPSLARSYLAVRPSTYNLTRQPLPHLLSLDARSPVVL